MLQNKISDYSESKSKRGNKYGVEIEAEGRGLEDLPKIKGWRRERDGSLGEGGVEFVQESPSSVEVTQEKIARLQKKINEFGASIRSNPRAGVHIHVNFQDQTVNELFVFLTAYYCLEDALVRLCHPGREGNFFCLRVTDSAEPVDRLLSVLDQGRFQEISTHGNLRYSAMNLDPLLTYGSVEFRALHCPTRVTEISDWVEMLDQLKNHSIVSFSNPAELIDGLSQMGTMKFIDLLLPSFSQRLKDLPDIEELIQQGCWNIQRFAFHQNNQ